jgi:hypothetical protein
MRQAESLNGCPRNSYLLIISGTSIPELPMSLGVPWRVLARNREPKAPSASVKSKSQESSNPAVANCNGWIRGIGFSCDAVQNALFVYLYKLGRKPVSPRHYSSQCSDKQTFSLVCSDIGHKITLLIVR